VLVGAFAGGLYGFSSITPEDLDPCSASLLNRITTAADKLAATWDEESKKESEL
jgi:hypothetical protein